ncbi:MAG: hypothetical protein WCP55_06805 [Lentisphaerota bacterium]
MFWYSVSVPKRRILPRLSGVDRLMDGRIIASGATYVACNHTVKWRAFDA